MEQLFPAIICVGYNRPDAMETLLTSIGVASYPEGSVPLIVSIDWSDRQKDVKAVADAFNWTHGEKTVRCFDSRQGLRNHILQCGDLSGQYGAAIVLEDDLIVSPAFYQYAAKAASFYNDEASVCGVALYSHAWNGYANVQFLPQKNGFDTYLGQFSITWGECWTKRQWQGFRTWYAAHEGGKAAFDERMPEDITHWPETSWGKYFVSYIIEKDLSYVMPYTALATNNEQPGQHNAGGDNSHQVMLLDAADMPYRFAPIQEAVQYDIFFERRNLPLPSRLDISSDEVCVDLHGQHATVLGKAYLLTLKKYDAPVIASFGLRLRPIEINVIRDLPGDVIRLYRVDGVVPRLVSDDESLRMEYELYRFGWRRLLNYSVGTCFKKLCGRIRRTIIK